MRLPDKHAPEPNDRRAERRRRPESEGAEERVRELQDEIQRMKDRIATMKDDAEGFKAVIVSREADIAAQRAEIDAQKAKIDAQTADIVAIKENRRRFVEAYHAGEKEIAELRKELEKASKIHKHTSAQQDQRIRAKEDELVQTQELMAARSTELSAAQSFLSTADRIPEADVLGIVRNLNENIFQVAANLTEEWEKFRARVLGRYSIPHEDLDSFSRAFGYPLIRRANRRRPTAVTYLIQACLCDCVLNISSNWKYNEKLSALSSAHEGISTSEGQAISARWRALTYSHLPGPPSHSESIATQVANVLWITQLFQSPQHSLDFVKRNVFGRIETINELATRLESVFMVDVTSSDMSLLFEYPNSEFDETRMINEFESGGSVTPGRKDLDKVAGTIEVGVEKCVYGRGGEGRRTEVLSKAKVVLERDIWDL